MDISRIAVLGTKQEKLIHNISVVSCKRHVLYMNMYTLYIDRTICMHIYVYMYVHIHTPIHSCLYSHISVKKNRDIIIVGLFYSNLFKNRKCAPISWHPLNMPSCLHVETPFRHSEASYLCSTEPVSFCHISRHSTCPGH